MITGPLGQELNQWLLHLLPDNLVATKEIWVGGRIANVGKIGNMVTNFEEIMYPGMSPLVIFIVSPDKSWKNCQLNALNHTLYIPPYYHTTLQIF